MGSAEMGEGPGRYYDAYVMQEADEEAAGGEQNSLPFALISEERFALLSAEAEEARKEALAEVRRLEEWQKDADKEPPLEEPASSLSEYRERMNRRWAGAELSDSLIETSRKRLDNAEGRLREAIYSLQREGMPEGVWIRTGRDGVLLRRDHAIPHLLAGDSSGGDIEEALPEETEEAGDEPDDGGSEADYHDALLLYRAPWWAIESEMRWQRAGRGSAGALALQTGATSATSAHASGGFPSPESVAARSALDTANIAYARGALENPSSHPAALQAVAGFAVCTLLGLLAVSHSAHLWWTGAQDVMQFLSFSALSAVLSILLGLAFAIARINAGSGGISLGSSAERAAITGMGALGKSMGDSLPERCGCLLEDVDRTTGGTLWTSYGVEEGDHGGDGDAIGKPARGELEDGSGG